MISDSILESDEEENEEEKEDKRGRPLAKLCILKNEHIPETGECFTLLLVLLKLWCVHLCLSLPKLNRSCLCISYNGCFLSPRVAPLFGR